MHKVPTEGLSKSEKRLLWDKIIQDYLSSEKGLKRYSEENGINYDHLSYYVYAYKRKQAKSSGFISLPMPSSVSPRSAKQKAASCEIRVDYTQKQIYLPTTLSSSTLQCLLKGLLS